MKEEAQVGLLADETPHNQQPAYCQLPGEAILDRQLPGEAMLDHMAVS